MPSAWLLLHHAEPFLCRGSWRVTVNYRSSMLEIAGSCVGRAPLSINLLATQEHHAERYLFDSVPGRASAIHLVIKSSCHTRDGTQNLCALAPKNSRTAEFSRVYLVFTSVAFGNSVLFTSIIYYYLLLGTGRRIHRLQTAPQPPALQASSPSLE